MLCTRIFALPASLTAKQLYHSQWTSREGAPAGIQVMAQTHDGFLYMGNSSGLFRFDGLQFERIDSVNGQPLPSTNVLALWARPQGGLWIGYELGGASLLQDGRLVNYQEPQGLPRVSIGSFAQSADGSVWAGTTHGLFHLANGQWTSAGADWNVSHGSAKTLLLDGSGTMWVLIDSEVICLRRGAHRFAAVDLPVALQGHDDLLASPDGHVWLSATLDGVISVRDLTDARRDPVVLSYRPKPDMTDQLLFDRDGNLWLADKNGIERAAFEPRSSRGIRAPAAQQGDKVTLTSEFPFWMLEDREGNIWIGTSNGLDQFRDSVLARADLSAPDTTFTALDSHIPRFPLAATPNGGLWIGTPDDFILEIDSRRQRLVGGPQHGWTCLYRDPHGDLWVGVYDAIWRMKDHRWTVFHGPGKGGFSAGSHSTQAMVMDESGAMWVSVVGAGVYRIVDGRWIPWGGRDDLPRQPATVLTVDDRGRIWFGYVDNTIAVLDGDRVRTLSAAEGLQIGAVLSISQQGRTIWVGGERGLARWDGQTFRALRWQGPAPQDVSGIVFTREGHLWLSTSRGAVSIDAEQVSSLVDPTHPIQYRLLDYLDGMPGTANVLQPLPKIAMDAHNRIWFSTNNGVAWVDPKRSVHNDVVPEVILKSVRADGVSHDLSRNGQSIVLPVRTHSLEITYTAPSLTMPERVRFRYQLEGSDADWQEAGARRQAFYTDLRPGNYRFRVLAANNDGIWNETGANVELYLPPTFMQTGWFFVLCGVMALFVIWLLFFLRLRHVEAQLRWRLQERLVERERIARDLHDTFLQGVQGLMLRFQSAAELIPEQEPARSLMEKALDRADEVLAEGRDKVTGLRLPAERPAEDLAPALNRCAAALEETHGVKFVVTVEGVPRNLHPAIQEEVEGIGTEALANAFRHAQASWIQVLIEYSANAVVLRVCDDGRGFDPGHTPGVPGHWGLQGMKERAARIDAQLKIISRIGAGTTVVLRVFAREAFGAAPTWPGRLLDRLKRKPLWMGL